MKLRVSNIKELNKLHLIKIACFIKKVSRLAEKMFCGPNSMRSINRYFDSPASTAIVKSQAAPPQVYDKTVLLEKSTKA